VNHYSTLIDLLIKAEIAGTPKHEAILLLGETPDYLIRTAAFPTLPLAIQGSTISKAFFDHGITLSFLQRLPDVLRQPKCVFRSANPAQEDSVVVLTFELKGFAPVIVPIRQDRMVGRRQRLNLVTSVYGKEGPDPEARWKAQGLLLWQPVYTGCLVP